MEARPLVQRLAERLENGGRQPAAHLIVEEVWTAVVEGTVATGERLPTARQLAIALGVSPRSVERAYDELERRGVTATRVGQGTFISLAPPSELEHARHRELAAMSREVVERAEALGFGVDDLIDSLAEFRTADRDSSQQDGTP